MVDHIGEGTKFGRYALLDKIGTGGMAEIFRAKTFGAAGFEKEFAIKLILPSLVDDNEFVEMFINEAKIAVSLYHANIVQVFDLGEIEGQYYIAMEYVLGKDLLEVLARCAERSLKIPLNLVLFITMEMLKGLNFAHRAKDPFGEDLNIIHRDVSPSNIMISYAGDVKVGDFGVAKAAIQRTLTESGTLKGKVGYMSPEQVMGEEIDARSDVFAAGVVFFEALSMSRLFVGSSDLEVMLQVRDADIEDNLAKAEPLPAGLREIVHKALSKHREERFQTSGEFYQALVDFCYQHGIKVTGTDLSNFMRRLFAEEIEDEKSRRRAEPRLQQIMQQSQPPKEKPPLEQTPPGAAERALEMADSVPMSEAEESVNHVPMAEASDDNITVDAAADSQPESAGNSTADEWPTGEGEADQRYRYRDSSGLIYGPMQLATLVDLIAEQQELDGDRVSVDGGEWKELDAFDEIRPHLKEEKKTFEDQPDVADEEAERAATVRAPAPPAEQDGVGSEKTTLPEENDLARELEEAVSSLEELSRGLAESSPGQGPSTIPFELSSGVFNDAMGMDEPSAINEEAPDADELVGGDVTTADEEVTNQAIAELREQYASYEGKLATVPFSRILARLHRSDATGRLHVQDGSIEKSIFLREGEPILVDSNKKEELLGAFLLRRERITQDQLDEALDRLSEWGGRLGDALVAIGAIQAHDIFELLSEQMREKLLDIFTWSSGHYGYYENQEPDTMGYPLGVDTYSTIVQACREDIPLDLITEFYDGRMHVSIFKNAQPPIDIDRLKLSARELRVTTQFEAGTNLRQLLDQIDEDRKELVLRTVYLLHQVELLKFETTDKVDLPE